MVFAQEPIHRFTSPYARQISTLPILWSNSNNTSPTPSTSWDQLSTSNEIERNADLAMYWGDVRFIAISGKRKCGKDYFATLLRNQIQEKFGQVVAIIHISEPIKRAFAEEHQLELQKLMSSSTYKERYRRHMVRWGEALRRQDPTIFCRKALEYLVRDSFVKPAFVIVADCRRPTDIEYFSNLNKDSPLLHLRISASLATRRMRGWIYSSGIDDAETECALDMAPFDILVVNESHRTLNLSMTVVLRALNDNSLRKIMTI